MAMVLRFPTKKNAGYPKAPRDFRQEKMTFSSPFGLSWDSPPPEHVRMGGGTLTSEPNFLGSIGYQICLAMELRWQAVPTGFTNT